MDSPDNEKRDYARLFDAMAESARQEAAALKNATHQKALWGLVAGLEIAACIARDTGTLPDPTSAAQLLQRYKATHYAYLIKKERKEVTRRPPNLHVKRIVKGKKPD